MVEYDFFNFDGNATHNYAVSLLPLAIFVAVSALFLVLLALTN